MVQDKNSEINLYVDVKKPLRFKPVYKFSYEFADRLSAVECILVDMAEKLGIPYDADDPKTVIDAHFKPIEQKLRKEGADNYTALCAEQQLAKTESTRMLKDRIIPVDDFSGIILDWDKRFGSETLEELVVQQLGIADIKAVREKEKFESDLSRLDNRLIDIDIGGSDKKQVRIKFRQRFPPNP